MRGPLAVALAVLLAVAPAVVAVPAGHTAGYASPTAPALAPVVPGANTTGYLALPSDDIQTERFGTATIDVSSALAADAGRLDAAFTRRWFGEAYAAADSDAERRLVLGLAADRVGERIDSLHDRERAALEAFNARELSTREYLRELAVIDARADALERVIDQLGESAERIDDPPVTDAQLARFEVRLLPLQGPVRDRVGQALAGGFDEPLRVYVETSSGGIVLAVVTGTDDGAQYVREAHLPSARNPAAENQFDGDLGSVLERFSGLYSWAAENTNGSISVGHFKPTSVYLVTIPHLHGQLTAYLDGGTNTTFLEHQRKDLSQTPTDVSVTNAADGLRLRVNRTHVGGPLEVRVVDNATGEPVDARITIDDEPIGRTGADGRLWTIAPPARFTVNATDAGRQVSVDTFSRREP